MLNDFNVLLSDQSTTHIIRLLVAALLGFLIGLEREVHGRAAGLRTHLLVCMGSAVFMILSESIARSMLDTYGPTATIPDPGRIAAQVVTGIGFLGAGTILKEGFTIRGLTTAACLWIAAGIGLTAGAGLYTISVATTFISLFFLISLQYFEKICRKDTYRVLAITTDNETSVSEIIEQVKSVTNLRVTSFDLERNFETKTTLVEISTLTTDKGVTAFITQQIVQALEQAKIPVKKIRWSKS